MTNRRVVNGLLCQLVATFFCSEALAYAYTGQDQGFTSTGDAIVWENPASTMHLKFSGPDVPLRNGTTTWKENAEDALAEWNSVGSAFRWQVGAQTNSVCSQDDQVNVATFMTTICGARFGDAVAVTLLQFQTNSTGRFVIVNADVIFDKNRLWNAYEGELVVQGGEVLYDFKRVALHEFGHAAGLAHPDDIGQSVSAIMNSNAQYVDRLQLDDQLGLNALYPAGMAAPSKANQSGGSAGGGALSVLVMLGGWVLGFNIVKRERRRFGLCGNEDSTTGVEAHRGHDVV